MHKILLIEDDVIMHRLLKGVLTGEGWELSILATGIDALAQVHKQKPDLILLDVHLPDRTGFEICAEIKGDPISKLTPILMLTGEARGVEDRIQGLELGADDYILKPFSPVELVERIKRILIPSAS